MVIPAEMYPWMTICVLGTYMVRKNDNFDFDKMQKKVIAKDDNFSLFIIFFLVKQRKIR